MVAVNCAEVEIRIELVETTVVSHTVGGLSRGNHHEGPGAAWPQPNLGVSPAKLAKTAKLRDQIFLGVCGWVAFVSMAREIPVFLIATVARKFAQAAQIF
jgi:hypothetical protein